LRELVGIGEERLDELLEGLALLERGRLLKRALFEEALFHGEDY
jgi:hypothetical protein